MNWKDKLFENIYDTASTKKTRPAVRLGDPFAALSPRLKALILTKKPKSSERSTKPK